MPNRKRLLTLALPLLMAACAAEPQNVQLAGPFDSIARSPTRRLTRGCSMPVLDNPALAGMLMEATAGGPMVEASAFECRRRGAI